LKIAWEDCGGELSTGITAVALATKYWYIAKAVSFGIKENLIAPG
jgi:hypothetical protein